MMPEKPEGAGDGADQRKENRALPRYEISAYCEVFEPKTRTRFKGRVSDLGRGGCFVDTISPFSRGTVTKLLIRRDDQSFEATGRVAYALEGMGMGLLFTKAEPEQLWTLEQWLREASGEDELEAAPDDSDGDSELDDVQGMSNEVSFVVNELILELLRNGILSEAKSKDMLQKLFAKQFTHGIR